MLSLSKVCFIGTFFSDSKSAHNISHVLSSKKAFLYIPEIRGIQKVNLYDNVFFSHFPISLIGLEVMEHKQRKSFLIQHMSS